VSPELASLVALQQFDSATETLRKRLGELPAAEQALTAAVEAASAAVDAAKARIHDNTQARRALEKDVAAVDTRLARFEDHKAAVKTNHEYTALLHEIATAKAEKDGIEERLLLLMEEGDMLASALKAAEAEVKGEQARAGRERAALAAERVQVDAELARLAHERTQEARGLDPPTLAKYEQLLKVRRGLAVARMHGEICGACHVRMRPHVAQLVRRNDEVIQCDSCQRILYYEAPAGGT